MIRHDRRPYRIARRLYRPDMQHGKKPPLVASLNRAEMGA
jgi:hypothetical protein